jgi:hypothetical protein
LPSHYITLSPNDITNQVVLRLSQPATSASSTAPVDIPLFIDKSKTLAKNPAAAATVFMRIVECLFTKLIGCKLSHKTKAADLPPSVRLPGSCGVPLDYYCIFEVQGRG